MSNEIARASGVHFHAQLGWLLVCQKGFQIRTDAEFFPKYHLTKTAYTVSNGYVTSISTGENFAFLYTGTAEKIYRQVLQVLKLQGLL